MATSVTVRGEALDASASLDLDSQASPSIDRGWRVRIDDAEITTTWRDRQTLDVTVPRGVAPGVHDVIAVSPTGQVLVLPRALTVTTAPLGLVLAIEDAPDGAGHPVAADVAAGDSIGVFAVVRDATHAFVENVEVEWGQTSDLGEVTTTAGTTVWTAHHVGSTQLTAHEVSADLQALSGALQVHPGPPARIAVVDPNGQAIGAVSGLTTDPDGGLTARAVALDAFQNVIGETDVTWTLTGVAGVLATASPSSTSIDFTTPGTGVLHASNPLLGAAQTGDLSVSPGRAATLAISPSTLVTSADAAPVAFTVSASDVDGNATTNLGNLTWAVASGPISALDATTGVLDPAHAGTGTISVTSSLGASAVSGAVTIAPGAPVALVIAPSSWTTDADAPPRMFSATATDADANPTPTGALTWSVASGPITALDPATGSLDPTVAGDGVIRATAAGGASGTATVSIAPGRAANLVASPDTLDIAQGGMPVTFGVTASDADGNATANLGVITWSIASGPIGTLTSSGVLTPALPGSGAVRVATSYGATDSTGTVTIRRRAALTASLAVSGPISVGGSGTATLTITNTGEIAASAVQPCVPTTTGGLTTSSAPAPSSTSIPGGGTRSFTWTVSATAAGAASVTSCATGTDAATGAAIASASTTATLTVLTPASLAATLSLPTVIGRGASLTVTMSVTNTGQSAATAVAPSALAITGSGSMQLTGGAPSGASIAGGGTAVFTWTYRAVTQGAVVLSGAATGTDAGSGGSISTGTISSNTAQIVEAVTVASNPFGDGSAFGFVTGYRGQVYLGPNKTGAAAVRFAPMAPSTAQSLTFTFTQDTTGNKTANSAVPYRSLGATGCTANTASCGPDNEDGRGTFKGVTLGGTEWLVAQGAQAARGLSYLYMTTDSDPVLDFAYVDLTGAGSSGELFAGASLVALGSTLYIGTIGRSGAAATVLALSAQPTAPGLDASSSEVIDLKVTSIPGMSVSSTAMIDTLATFGGVLYLANSRGWARSTVSAPRPYTSSSTDWALTTPTAAAYAAETSRTTMKIADLVPSDRAVPQMATFGGRLFVARNTTSGPQLWACTPATSGTATQCDPGDWSVVAPNTTGDPNLTQFNDPALTSISMVAATSEFLYVGFDSPGGVQVFRTATASASTRADFEGVNGCSAATHPASCAPYGGVGLGIAGATRILDGKSLSFATSTSVWLTIGDGTSPLSLVMLP